jgi:two-component system CheB/CheR fusion protein
MESRELSPQEYRELVEQAPIMIWRADLSMGCDYFNQRWLKFTGRP